MMLELQIETEKFSSKLSTLIMSNCSLNSCWLWRTKQSRTYWNSFC